MTWGDPTTDLVNTARELMFRSAIAYSNFNRTAAGVQRIRVSQTRAANAYKSRFDYFGITVGCMVLQALVISYMLFGWHRLGRDVSLDAFEIARAMGAPALQDASSNSRIDVALSRLRRDKFRYGELVSETSVDSWTGADQSQGIGQGTSSHDYVFVTVESDLDPTAVGIYEGHTVPSYFSLFIFAFVYELVLVYDALRLNSMIQLVGLCIFNTLLLLYAAAQPSGVKKALDVLAHAKNMDITPLLKPGRHTWERISPALTAVIVDQAVATAALFVLTYKLRSEFAWVVYKVLNADLSMKRRLLNFQVYMALIKFNFFFLVGFLVQTVSLVPDRNHDPEFPLTIVGIFVAFAAMCLAIYCATYEKKAGTVTIIVRPELTNAFPSVSALTEEYRQVAYMGAAAYLSYKLSVLYSEDDYPLITFNCVALAMVICNIVMAMVCMANFGKGLSTYTRPQKKLPQEDFHLHDTQSFMYSGVRASRLDLAD
ncbi:hypothetical protein PG997_011882 [Apiospora hydei]|uniref:TRP C-terminal domain-containing protein n=1 Tax=Apiospora hydei TaxID=1337664 RepID=A0ABR1V4E2_9PEZI